MSEPVVPDSLANVTLAYPRWLRFLYVLTVLLLGVGTGSFWGFIIVIVTAMISFLFWTRATWRGLQLREEELNGR